MPRDAAYPEYSGQERIDALLAQAETNDVRNVLMAEGYDGVVVHWAPGDTWVVAYLNEQVKVVRGA